MDENDLAKFDNSIYIETDDSMLLSEVELLKNKSNKGIKLPANNNVVREIEFNIISSEKSILATVSQLLKRKGYICISPKPGVCKILLDGRENMNGAIDIMTRIVSANSSKNIQRKMDYVEITERARDFLIKKGFSSRLIGTEYLAHCLTYLTLFNEGRETLTKGAYRNVAKASYSTVKAVDRNIKYAAKSARFDAKNSKLINNFLSEFSYYILK